jgi:nucleotide-binding universal stress UspA family protein
MVHIRHILVPTDFSDGAREAFTTAIGLARDSGARLTLFHVNHVPTSTFPDVILPMTPDLVRDIEYSTQTVLKRWCAEASEAGVECDWKTTFGATHVEICNLAERLEVDLICMGTHGHTGLSHVLLGSVAEKVVRKAPCPVLTVRPQMHSTFAHP